MLIDAHIHVWRLARGDYPWPTAEQPALWRDFGLDDYAAAAAGLDIGGVILVQAAATRAETEFLLDCLASDPRVVGVTGWLDFAVPPEVAELAALRHRGLCAVRPMLQDMADRDWIVDRDHDRAFARLVEADVVFEALVRPDQLDAVATIAARHPDLRIVVDHGGKPAIAAGTWQPWADDMARLARHANVWCKLSGLLTEGDGDARAIARYAAHVLDCFGLDRLIWGSDWPVVTLAASLGDWLGQARALIDSSPAVLGGNAARVYRLAGAARVLR